VRSDLQETEVETFARVVAWSTAVQLFLVLSLTLEWRLAPSISAVLLFKPLYLTPSCGFICQEATSLKKEIQLVYKSLDGLSVAPCLWYEHLSKALKEEGFKTCINDPCLLAKI
jgi:hypothetical protein